MSVKVAKRTLADIATEIRVELRTQTSSLLKVGRCLIEAKKQLKSAKGEDNKWLPWLASEVGMHERTAQRYLKAAKFAAKYDTVSYLSAEGEETLAVERLSPSAIYAISADVEDLYTPEAITAILEEAKTKEVDEDRALEIAQSLAPPDASVSTDEPEPEPSSDETASDEDDKSESEEEVKDGQTDEEKEAEDILDGAPPIVPPAAPPEVGVVEAHALTKFEDAVKLLLVVMTKSASTFRGTYHTGADLESVADFLKSVAATKIARAA